MARTKKNPKAKRNPKASQIGPDSIMIDGEIYDVDNIATGSYLPLIEVGNQEFYVAKDSTAAGKATRKYWSDMAQHDKSEFRATVGDEALLAWALGEPGGPGSAKVTSLQAWLNVTAEHPEENFASYDGNERTVQAVGANVKKELGFTPKVAYRHN